MANYKITRCTVEDAPAIARNNISAFWEDAHYRLSWPHRSLDEHISESVERSAWNLLDSGVNKRHQKAVGEAGQLLGYARWNIPPPYSTDANGNPAWAEAVVPAVSAAAEAVFRQQYGNVKWTPDNRADALEAPVQEARKEILGRKPYMRLDYLAVHKDHQGRGIATALVQSGLEQAERLGLDVFIQAYRAGLGVYERLGFRVDKEVVQDISQYGREGEHGVYFMLRETAQEVSVI